MQADCHCTSVQVRMRFAFCYCWGWGGKEDDTWSDTHTHGWTHTHSFVLDTGIVCSYTFKAQAVVTSLWNPHNNVDCYRYVGIYFMLRLLLALRMVHQVVTWKTKQKTESHRSKMPHGTHEQLCFIIFERILRPILRIPMTNFMDFVWVFFSRC